MYQWNNTRIANMKLFIFMSNVNMGTLPSTQNTFWVLLESICHIKALITNCDKSQVATAGIPELSQFVTVAICDGSKRNFSDWCQQYPMVYSLVQTTRSHTHRTISRRFYCYIVYGLNYWYTYKQIFHWKNTKMGKNTTFHIHVQSEPGYSPKYPEHVFSVIGLSLCRHGHDHKMRQIIKCDGKDSWIVAICDCRILWRFKMQLLRFMSVVQEGILLIAGNMFTSTSDTIKKVSFVNWLWAL